MPSHVNFYFWVCFSLCLFWGFVCLIWPHQDLSSPTRIEPGPLQWRNTSWTTGLPGNSHHMNSFKRTFELQSYIIVSKHWSWSKSAKFWILKLHHWGQIANLVNPGGRACSYTNAAAILCTILCPHSPSSCPLNTPSSLSH